MSGESADQQPLPQPKSSSVVVPAAISISSGEPQAKHDANELKPQEEKPLLAEEEWGEILRLGSKPFLDLNPDELAKLQNLSGKGRELLGDDFDSQLETKKAEAMRQKDEQETERSEKLNRDLKTTADNFGREVDELVQGFEGREAARKTEIDSKEAELRRQLKEIGGNKTTEQVLEEALKDPKMAGVKAELAWIDLLGGKPVEGVDPEFAKSVAELKKDAIAKIMTDPQGYEQDLQKLKAVFYKSRGVDLGSNPKDNAI